MPAVHAISSSTGTGLKFGLLGPLEVWDDGGPIQLRGRQEHALLALLLTAPGRVFSVAAIVEALWGEAAPGRAAKTVQSYVSRLRHSMPSQLGDLVVTRNPGYAAVVEPEQVDVECFKAMVATGRRLLAAGHPADAATALRAALELWRGEPYGEFDAPFAAAERTALEELRLAAVEDRVAADLATGAGPELVAELDALAARHPWRERLWAQLMTALYRSGRQADALRAFQRARRALGDELGLEPGPVLREVEALVLAQDDRLVWAGPPPPEDPRRGAAARRPRAPMAPRPVICPYKGSAHYDVDDARYFAGRDRLVAHLVARVVDSRLVVVVGEPRSGKSSLVRAGLIAALRAGTLPGSDTWRTALTTPTQRHPAPPGDDHRSLLVVDQLEELFTALGPRRRTESVHWLAEVAARPGATVVLVLGSDCYPLATADRRLAHLLATDPVHVPEMAPSELRRAIEAPAAAACLELEAGLVDAIVDDVQGEHSALALVSHALLALWERREGRRLTRAAYRELGGVQSVAARLAKAAPPVLPVAGLRSRPGLWRRHWWGK